MKEMGCNHIIVEKFFHVNCGDFFLKIVFIYLSLIVDSFYLSQPYSLLRSMLSFVMRLDRSTLWQMA